MSRIVQKEDPVLRQTAQKVPIEKITTESVQDVVRRMKEALETEDDGVAIAAPQIGKSLRIFVVAGKVFDRRNEKRGRETDEAEEDHVYINPEIINRSSDTHVLEEGCLSCRWWYGEVERAEKVTVRAYDENGDRFEEGASGLLSQIFQHEIDHLDGILFIDKAENLHELPPKE